MASQAEWNNIFAEIYFNEPRVGYLPTSVCHKTIRARLTKCLKEYNQSLKEVGEQPEVTEVKVSRGGEDKWKITFVSTSLSLL